MYQKYLILKSPHQNILSCSLISIQAEAERQQCPSGIGLSILQTKAGKLSGWVQSITRLIHTDVCTFTLYIQTTVCIVSRIHQCRMSLDRWLDLENMPHRVDYSERAWKNPHRKSSLISQNSNQGPSCCAMIVLTIEPRCSCKTEDKAR